MDITGVKPGTFALTATINYSLTAVIGTAIAVMAPEDLISLTCDSDLYTMDTTLITSDKN